MEAAGPGIERSLVRTAEQLCVTLRPPYFRSRLKVFPRPASVCLGSRVSALTLNFRAVSTAHSGS